MLMLEGWYQWEGLVAKVRRRGRNTRGRLWQIPTLQNVVVVVVCCCFVM